jgi:hypothetical protein
MEIKNLFLVKFEKNNSTELMTESRLEYYRKYPKWYGELTVVEELGKLWPKNAAVAETTSGSGRCYVWKNYKITADEKLNEQDMDIIRAQYSFLSGQRTADVNLNSFKEENGKFVYEAFSERDSGD